MAGRGTSYMCSQTMKNALRSVSLHVLSNTICPSIQSE